MNKTLLGLGSLLVAGAIFGSFGIWVRLLSSDLSSYQQIAFRNIIALIIALGIIFFRKIKLSFSGVSPKYLILFGLSFPVAVIFYTFSMLKTSIMLGIFSFYLGSILFSLLLGTAIFKEKITTQKILSLTLVLTGFYFFIQPNGLKQLDLGMIFGIIAGLFDTISNAFRKHLAGKLDRVVLTLIPQIGGIAVATILMSIFGGLSIPEISTNSWLVGIAFGSLLFAINYLTLYGFQNFDLNLGTIAISTEVVFATIFGWLVFSEIPRSSDLLGAGFIVLAIILGNLPRLAKK